MRQPHKMVKYTQTVHRQQSTNCLSVFDHVVGLGLNGLISVFAKYKQKEIFQRKQKVIFLHKIHELSKYFLLSQVFYYLELFLKG